MKGAGLEAIGRSAFVRTSGGRLLGAALHKGQRLTADGALLFETDSFAHAVLTFTASGVEAKLSVYDPRWVRIHVDRRPAKVLVDGKDRPFEYDATAQYVQVACSRVREVRVQYD